MPVRTPVLRRILVALIVIAALGLAACAPARGGAGRSTQTGMANLINGHRAMVGSPALALCGTLNRAAQAQSNYQASINRMTHSGDIGALANGSGYHGWTALAENVAYGYPGVTQVVNAWLASPGHRTNLLNPGYQHIGVGLAYHGSTPYWTLEFGRGGRC